MDFKSLISFFAPVKVCKPAQVFIVNVKTCLLTQVKSTTSVELK